MNNYLVDPIILIAIAAALSLPFGLLVAFQVSLPRSRFLGMVGGVIGAAAVAAAVYYFVQVTGIVIDALSYFIGGFFACSAGVIIGAVLANFLLDLLTRAGDASSQEF